MNRRPRSTLGFAWVLGAALGLCPVRPAWAQVAVELRAGAAWSAPVVKDVVVNPISVRPGLAPTVGVALSAPLRPGYAAELTVDWARSDLNRTERGETTAIGRLTRWTAMVSGRRAITDALAFRAGLGLLKYAPAGTARDATFFRNDAPVTPLFGVGVSVRRPVTRRYAIGVDLGYDLHQFSTAALRTAGFTGRRTVHRLTLRVTIGTSHAQTER